MNKATKGMPGYYKNRKIKFGIFCLIGFLLVFGVYFAGYWITGTNKNLLTVLAMIIFIPTAKFLIDYFMIPWKSFVGNEEFAAVSKECEPLPVYAELVITASEKRYNISFVVVDKDENIVAYTKDEKADKEAFKKGVKNFLNYYDFDAKTELYSDYEAFMAKCRELASNNSSVTDEDDEHIALVLSKLSIMSI